MSALLAGAVLTVVLAAGSAAVWGAKALLPAAVFGALATAIQVQAHRLARKQAGRSPFPAGWLAGTAMRLGGVVLLAVLVLVNRQVFAPLPAAIGYLGVLIPLLMLELRKTS
jgi:hypothetical protein